MALRKLESVKDEFRLELEVRITHLWKCPRFKNIWIVYCIYASPNIRRPCTITVSFMAIIVAKIQNGKLRLNKEQNFKIFQKFHINLMRYMKQFIYDFMWSRFRQGSTRITNKMLLIFSRNLQ
jgi:hypothetical protein